PTFANAGSGLALAWTLDTLTASMPDAAATLVIVGHKPPAGPLQTVSAELPLISSYTVPGQIVGDEFAIALVFHTPLLASGINQSFWSPNVRPVNCLSSFNVPSSLDLVTRNIAILRRYHARRTY